MANKIPPKQVTIYDYKDNIYTLIPFEEMMKSDNMLFKVLVEKRTAAIDRVQKREFARQMMWEALVHTEDRAHLIELSVYEIDSVYLDWLLAEEDNSHLHEGPNG